MVARLLSPRPFAPRLGGKTARRLLLLALAVSALVFARQAVQKQILPDGRALEAASLMRLAMLELKDMRRDLGIEVDETLDPALSGLIGVDYTDLTTSLGDLRAKQTSLNPRFASLVAIWLQQAGVRAGDKVALCFTGSFPALNLAVLCACAALEVRPLIISSVGASTYGANLPGFTWLDMEIRLNEAGLIPWRSQYASLGGIMDSKGGIDGTGFDLAEAAIARHGATYLREGGYRAVAGDVERRLGIYLEDGPPAVFINVGGNVTALGWVSEAALLDNGLLSRVPSVSSNQRGLIFRMFEAGVPVIHILNIERLAAVNHLPIAPVGMEMEEDWIREKQRQTVMLGTVLLVWLCLSALLIRRECRVESP
jgi:poly-gamma-glutamate system protein